MSVSQQLIIALVIVSGAMHAVWNTLAKSVRADRDAFMLLIFIVGMLITLPWGVTHLGSVHHPWGALGVVLARGACEAVYIVGVGAVYRHLDLSVAYPMMRGIGPVVTVVLATVFLGERPALIAVAGLALIALAVGSMALTAWHGVTRRGLSLVAMVGVTIGTYNVIDKVGVGMFDPITYMFCFNVVAVALCTVLIVARGRAGTVVATARAYPRHVAAGGLFSFGAYALVLIALSHTYASYIAPLREVGIVFGTLLGVFLFHEPGARTRLPAAAVIVTGIVLIGLAV